MRLRSLFLLFLAVMLVFLFWIPLHAADKFSGNWHGDGVSLAIEKTGKKQYAGQLSWRGGTFPLAGQIEGGVFWGEIEDGRTAYSYLLERAGRQLLLVIDSQSYFLDRAEGGGGSDQAGTARHTVQAQQPLRQPVQGQPGQTMVFRKVAISDAGGWIGGTAGTFLAPADWRVTASIQWFLHPTMPGRMTFTATSPDGRHTIRLHPHLTFFMGPTVVPMQEGYSEYYGNIYLRPAGDAATMIQNVILPWIHPDTRYTILGWTDLPAYARAIQEMNSQPGARSFADGKKARIEYQEGGRKIVEDVFAVYAVQQVGPVSYWQGQFISSVTSDEQHIQDMDGIHAVMMDSLDINLTWFNKYLQISDAFQQLAAMNQNLAANQSRIISNLSDQITANRRQVYENAQRSMDRANRNFSQYIRGVETWENQHGETMELPAGYEQGWQSNDGTILITDNPNLNPNTDPGFKNKSWQGMRKRGN